MAEHFIRKNYDSTYCNFLNIKLRHEYFSANITKFSEQVLLKHLQEHIILLKSKSEHMFSQAASNHNLKLFSERNYKKKTNIWFSFYIQVRYCNLVLKTHLTWAWKNSDYLTGLGLTLWYIRLVLEKCSGYLTAVRVIVRYIGFRLT